MAAGLGIAAGAFAKNYAEAMGLRSQLDDAEKRREAMGLQMENQRLQNESLQAQRDTTKALAELEKNWISGEGYRPAEAGQDYDHRTDPAAVARYYENLRSGMRAQAAAFGRPVTDADAAVDKLMRDKYQEKAGKALQMMRLNPEASIPAIRSVYDAFYDGNVITGGTYDKATDQYVFQGKDKSGNQVSLPMDRKAAIEALAYAATGTDAGKLYLKSLETDKVLKADSDNLGRRLDTTERIAKDDRSSRESMNDQDNQTRIKVANINASAQGSASAEVQRDRLEEQRQRALREGFNSLINRRVDSIKSSRPYTMELDQGKRDRMVEDAERPFLESRGVGEANVRFGAPADADLIHKVYTESRNPNYMGFVMDDKRGVKVKRDPVTGQVYGLTRSGVYVPAPTGKKFE